MNIEIRVLRLKDLKAVKALAKLIWEGHDYLQKVARFWIKDGCFWGMFEGDILIGCAKITSLPNKVVWLEGLRIHPDYQNQGLGTRLSKHIMDIALNLIRSGEAKHIEFSTYYLNKESIAISKQAGFELMDEYYILSHEPVRPAFAEKFKKIDACIKNYYPVTLPFGWKFLHPTATSINWLNNQTNLVQVNGERFYVGGENPTVCLLSPAGYWLKDALPYIQGALGKNKPIEILLHKSRRKELSALFKRGFHWWEEGTEDIVQIFRYQP